MPTIICWFGDIKLVNQGSSKSTSRRVLAIVVPITNLAGNQLNLHSWLSRLPDAEIEVFLVHDVQDSETSVILREILEELSNPRITYLEGKFGAPGIARNFAMPHINSEWFWFVDADDLPNVQLAFLELDGVEPKYEVVIGEFKVITQFSNTPPLISRNNSDLLRVARDPGIWRMIFKSNVFQEFRFREFRMAEDQIFLLDINFFERNLKFSEHIFYTYFKHNHGQLTSKKSAILDLRLTIPVVVSRLEAAKEIQSHCIEIMLARQLSTELKSANWSERLRILRINYSLMKVLDCKTRFRVCLEMFHIFTNRLVNN